MARIEYLKDQDVIDKFKVLSFGKQLKESLIKREYLSDVVFELKRRFKKLLYMYQDKKAE